jgi:hypothetical protein
MINNNDFLDRITNDIKKCGITVMGILGDEQNAPFYYSIGAREFNVNDIYTSCLSQQMGTFVVNNVFYHLVKENITEPCLIDGLLGGDLSLALVLVTDEKRMQTDKTFQAGNYYNDTNYQIFQIVLPDTNNKFPWESEFVDFSNGLQDLYFDINDQSLLTLPKVEVKQTTQEQLTFLLEEKRS